MEDVTSGQLICDARVVHRSEAASEFKFYRDLHCEARLQPTLCYHSTLYYAENVFLPLYVRKPGQLHFVTG